MVRIFLDTSAVVSAIAWRIDIFSELERICDFAYDVVVLDRVREEIEALAGGRSKGAEQARIALTVLEAKDVEILESPLRHPDDAFLELADKDDFVLTQDRELRKKLREKGLGTVAIRQKAYLELKRA